MPRVFKDTPMEALPAAKELPKTAMGCVVNTLIRPTRGNDAPAMSKAATEMLAFWPAMRTDVPTVAVMLASAGLSVMPTRALS